MNHNKSLRYTLLTIFGHMCPFVKISLNEECYWSPVTLFVHVHFLRMWTENISQLNESFIK
jgi:hypothetical protein